jgi:hypothetical protein
MAKISEYPSGGAPASGDLFIVARSGTNVRLLYSALVSALDALYAPIAKGVTNGNSHDHVGGDGAAIVEAAITLADNTTNNSSTTKHGFLIKATAPGAGIRNVVAIDNAETVYKVTALVDNTNPAAIGTAGPGTSLLAARRDHIHGAAESAITFTDITTNDASTTKHGYLIKATAPGAGIRNVVAIDNAETVYKVTALVDNTNPAALGTAAPGTSLLAARRDHVHTGWTLIRKTADEIRTATTTLTSDTHLVVTLLANKTYAIRGACWFDTTAAADFKYRFTFSGTLLYIQHVQFAAGSSLVTDSVDVTAGVTQTLIGAGTTGGHFEFDAIAVVDGSNRTFTLQWAQNTSDAGNTTLRAGTYMEYADIEP